MQSTTSTLIALNRQAAHNIFPDLPETVLTPMPDLTPATRQMTAIFLVIFLFFSGSCLADGFLQAHDADSLAGNARMAYHVDKTDSLGIADIMALPDHAFTDQSSHRLPSHHTIWYKLTASNTSDTDRTLYLDLGSFLFNSAGLYYLEEGRLQEQHTGLEMANPPRHLLEPSYAFPVHLHANENKTLYLKLQSDFNPHFAPHLGTAEEIHASHFYAQSLANGITGVMLGGLIYLLLISLTLRNRTLSIYFIAFLGSSIALQFTRHHNLHIYLDYFPGTYPAVYTILQCLNALLFISFCRQFFPIRENFPRMDKILGLAGIAYGAIIIWVLLVDTRYIQEAIRITTDILMFLLISVTLLFWHRKQPYTGLFLLAMTSFAALRLLSFLNDIHLVPHLFFTELSFGLGNCIVIFIFAIILAHQVNKTREEHSRTAEHAQKAQAQSQAKSDFLAKMSHEIRTPLNGVMGMIHLLKETPLNDSQQAYIDVIEQSGNTLMTVINDILDYSKVGAGKMTLENTSFNINNLLDGICSMFAETSHQQNTELSTHIDKTLPRTLRGDPTRISQVLNNLISNAIKFTREGQVSVEVKKLYSLPDNQHMVRFSVTDTGIGIDSRKVSQLFRAFEQADSSTTRLYGGTGLGLAICEQLVHLMHGNIGATSEPGKGSTFWFDLPLEESRQDLATITDKSGPAVKTPPVSRDFSDVSVLVAEDNEVNRKVIGGMLKQLKAHCTFAENGQEALRLVEQHHENFDIVLMDCEMPVMDGYMASIQIRKFEMQMGLPRLPIVALTAHVLDELRDKSMASGMDEHVAKPLQFATLEQTLSHWTASRGNWSNHTPGGKPV